VTNAEQLCAKFISDISLDKKPHFFVSTGDNFYEYGVNSVDDPRFKVTWDDVFVYGKEEKIPWYITLGNHDWYSNSSAQLAYTYLNDRWVSPNYAFTVSYDSRPKGPSVDLVYLDTVALCGNTWEDSDDDMHYIPQINKRGRKTDSYGGPQDPDLAEEIWTYVEAAFAKSTADYVFAVGHYPAFASDWHNISDCLVPRLQELMEKYSISGYLNGHAHNMQHITTTNRMTGQNIHHVLSGAGHLSKANYQPVFDNLTSNPYQINSEFFFPKKAKSDLKSNKDMGALVYMDLGHETGTVEYYKCNGENKYSFQVNARDQK
jgi:tartrate-resistant acid phosphatase type 5